MWLYTKIGFFSAVLTPNGDKIAVRARVKGDLQRLRKYCPSLSRIIETPAADYRFRAYCPRKAWAKAAGKLAGDINYPNFKATIKDKARHDAYLRVWAATQDLQAGGAYGLSSGTGVAGRLTPGGEIARGMVFPDKGYAPDPKIAGIKANNPLYEGDLMRCGDDFL